MATRNRLRSAVVAAVSVAAVVGTATAAPTALSEPADDNSVAGAAMQFTIENDSNVDLTIYQVSGDGKFSGPAKGEVIKAKSSATWRGNYSAGSSDKLYDVTVRGADDSEIKAHFRARWTLGMVLKRGKYCEVVTGPMICTPKQAPENPIDPTFAPYVRGHTVTLLP